MKYTTFFSLFLFSFFHSIAQDSGITAGLPLVNGNVVYEKIDSFTNKTKPVLFSAARQWLVQTFSGSVIDVADKDLGKLSGRVSFQPAGSNILNYVFTSNYTVDIKEGKTRFRLFDITYTVNGGTKPLVLNERVKDGKLKDWPELTDKINSLYNLYTASLQKQNNDDF